MTFQSELERPAAAPARSRIRAALHMPRRLDLMLLSLAGLATFFGIWALVSGTGLASEQTLPTPVAVAEEFVALLTEPFAGSTVVAHLLSSLQRFAIAFVLAAVIGVPLGLMMGWSGWLDDIVSPIFDALRFVPPLAWVPFAALWFGTGAGGPVLVIFTGAFPPCVINAYRGAKLVDPRLVEAGRTLGASSGRMIAEVLLPGSLPSIVAGLRVSAGLGWQSLVGAELIVASSGVGYMMVQAQSNLAPTIVISGMIAIGMVGFAIDALLRLLERRISRNWGTARE